VHSFIQVCPQQADEISSIRRVHVRLESNTPVTLASDPRVKAGPTASSTPAVRHEPLIMSSSNDDRGHIGMFSHFGFASGIEMDSEDVFPVEYERN
jgi:hypothetical protein